VKSHYVKDLIAGENGVQFQCIFRIARPEVKQKNAGGTFLTFLLSDKTGEIEAVWWEGNAQHLEMARQKPYAKICVEVNSYKGKRQVKAISVSEWQEIPDEISDFEKVAQLPLDTLCQRLDAHLKSVQNRHLKALLKEVFEDQQFRSLFNDAPAALRRHHACRHGLLQHTLEVTDFASCLAKSQRNWGYLPVSYDLVVAGALMHDVGKVHELSWTEDGEYEMTSQGEFLGHITQGILWMQYKIQMVSKKEKFPAELKNAILHIINSHHGKLEFGSPITPKFPEAQMIHAADQTSVELFYMQEAVQTASQEFVFVEKMERRKIYTRPWEHLEDTVIMPEKIEANPANSFVQNGGNKLPKFRFHSSGETPNTVFHTRRLPLIGRAAAGMPVFSEEHIENYFEVEDERLSAGDLYLLRIDGDSMTGDGIQDQDTVVVRRQSSQEPEIISVVYFDDRSEAAIKRIAKTKIDGIELLSSNPHYAPIPVADPSSLRVSGRVIGILQNPESDIHAS
jgi:3'-5' exoribonuclease